MWLYYFLCVTRFTNTFMLLIHIKPHLLWFSLSYQGIKLRVIAAAFGIKIKLKDNTFGMRTFVTLVKNLSGTSQMQPSSWSLFLGQCNNLGFFHLPPITAKVLIFLLTSGTFHITATTVRFTILWHVNCVYTCNNISALIQMYCVQFGNYIKIFIIVIYEIMIKQFMK